MWGFWTDTTLWEVFFLGTFPQKMKNPEHLTGFQVFSVKSQKSEEYCTSYWRFYCKIQPNLNLLKTTPQKSCWPTPKNMSTRNNEGFHRKPWNAPEVLEGIQLWIDQRWNETPSGGTRGGLWWSGLSWWCFSVGLKFERCFFFREPPTKELRGLGFIMQSICLMEYLEIYYIPVVYHAISISYEISWNIYYSPVRSENNAESSRVQADFNSSSLAPW